ncbi:SDR family oxidoreductase [Sphingomonas oryzagri]|uniref:NmrA family NAD(P)-binding protein n=1 Tax=Sphingomonas oryzagri TaxID=3042314 RepID=A0ABT6MY19_9SPHN|nr:NmrA family NAD(P)-binding protein [Sphingomonas oryzagri]MDH7637413.1 NmrA family NAD(P)-binding protein [Sphingomonas oryzagri]
MARTVAVIGASGRQGGAQVRQLVKAGFHVKALSRSADPFYGQGTPEGVEVVSADLYDEASLVEAFRGAEGVFHTHPLRARADRAVLVASVGRAAKAAGVERVVWNTSSWIPDRPGDPYTYAGNTAGINALFRTGVGATVFGSVLFMDNLLTNWARPFIVNEGRFVYAHRPDLEANWISLDDVARIMIHALDRPDMEGAWINIGGPERLKPTEVAERISPALGRKIVYDPCRPEEFGRLLANAAGDSMGTAEHDVIAEQIGAFYRYNNTAPTRPFEVDYEAMHERIPIELETIGEWAKRQDWANTNGVRPPFG